MRKLISVVAPMYNEEKLVHEYCKETLAVLGKIEEQYDYEVIVSV